MYRIQEGFILDMAIPCQQQLMLLQIFKHLLSSLYIQVFQPLLLLGFMYLQYFICV